MFEVMYTAQITKVKKTWHDGLLTFNPVNKRCTLLDESSNELAADFTKAADLPIIVGSELRVGKYMITVESESDEQAKVPDNTQSKATAHTNKARANCTYPGRRPVFQTTDRPYRAPGLTAHKRVRVGAAAFSVRLVPGKRVQQEKTNMQPAAVTVPSAPKMEPQISRQPQVGTRPGMSDEKPRSTIRDSNNKRRSAGSILSLLDKRAPDGEIRVSEGRLDPARAEKQTCLSIPDVRDVFEQRPFVDTLPSYSKRLAIPAIPITNHAHTVAAVGENEAQTKQSQMTNTNQTSKLRRDFQPPQMSAANTNSQHDDYAEDDGNGVTDHPPDYTTREHRSMREEGRSMSHKFAGLIPSIHQTTAETSTRRRAIPCNRPQLQQHASDRNGQDNVDETNTRLQSFFDMDADESMYDNGYTMATNRHIADVIDKEPKGSVRDGDHSTNAGTRMHLLYEASDSENVHDDDESLTEAAMDADRSNTDQGYDGETEPAASTDPLHTEPVKSLEDGGNGALKRLTGAYSGRANAALKIGSLSALDKLIGASKPSINYTSQPRHPNIGQINNAAPPAVVANARIRSFKPVILNAKAKRKLEFPSQDDILTSSGAAILQRVLTVPAGFDNVMNYKQHYESMLYEHANILIRKIAVLYHKALSQMDCSLYDPTSAVRGLKHDPNAPSCQHGKASSSVVKKEGKNQGRSFWHCAQPRELKCNFFKWEDASDSTGVMSGNTTATGNNPSGTTTAHRQQPKDAATIEAMFRKCHTMVFVACTVTKSNQKKRWYNKGKEAAISTLVDLTINRKEKHAFFSKNDLWALCSSLDFKSGVVFARSAFYGPNTDGTIELRPMEANGIAALHHGPINAIHLGNYSNELTCFDVLREPTFTPPRMPILPYLLNGATTSPHGPRVLLPNGRSQAFAINLEDRFETVEHHILKYTLNTDQAHALRSCAEMFSTADAPSLAAPVMVVNGAFGSGKSYWMAVLVLMLVQLFEQSDTGEDECADGGANNQRRPWKILISSNTNVAVDRVLTLLLSFGFTDFVRVGSVKKMARNILPHRIQSSGTKAQDMKDLKDLLKNGGLSDQDVRNVKESIKVLKAGADSERLSETRVVGVTCAATVFACLQPFSFPVVLLDESSQMTEPQAWLPIVPFGVEKLVLVGDHRQLPPTIQTDIASEARGQGLEFTMFERLARDNPEDVVSLYTQYRCHPSISAMSNQLFYDNALSNAVTVDDRQPLVEGLPTLCFYDVPRGVSKSQGTGSSMYNAAEAEFASYIVHTLVNAGVVPDDIGVVTLYRAQAQRIRAHLSDEAKRTLVSTVDAFQGGEREVVVLSCVMTGEMSGFADSFRRINVAITRARRHLLILGNTRALSKTKLWVDVIRMCEERHGSIERASDQFSVGKLTEESTPHSSSDSPQAVETVESVRERLQLTVRPDSPHGTYSKHRKQSFGDSDSDAELEDEQFPHIGPAVPRTDSDSPEVDDYAAPPGTMARRPKPKMLPC